MFTKLTRVTHNGFNYNFSYDSFGRTTAVKVGTQSLINYTYNDTGTVNTATYGNGQSYTLGYDALDRVTSRKYNGTVTYSYAYNNDGELSRVGDNESGAMWRYDYDIIGRLSRLSSDDGVEHSYTYANNNSVKTARTAVNGELLSSATYDYDDTENRLKSTTLNSLGSVKYEYNYNGINQVTSNKLLYSAGDNPNRFCTFYTYVTSGTNQTSLISTMRHRMISSDDTYSDKKVLNYTYDNNGNILTISEGSTLKASYVYDGLNQLIRENNAYSGKTVVYTYNAGGNITQKKEYAYTTGTVGTVTDTINYAYEDTNWKDKLTSYDAGTITYDTIGNPSSYCGMTMTWKKGRQLDTVNTGSQLLSFEYDYNGMRTKKAIGQTTTEYYYSGNLLMAQSDGTKTIGYLYSADGKLLGARYISTSGGTPYYAYYMYNVQGDVIGIYNSNGEVTCEYRYDAWGKCLGAFAPGTNNPVSSANFGSINPIRYRGYYYDAETGLYYVSSRYYDPETCRFINADTTDLITATPTALTDKNLYAYCDNNPIMRIDHGGQFWDTIFDALSLVVSIVDVVKHPDDPMAWAGLAADVVSLVVPFATGGGAIVKAVSKADDVVDVVKTANMVDNIVDTTKAVKKGGALEMMFQH